MGSTDPRSKAKPKATPQPAKAGPTHMFAYRLTEAEAASIDQIADAVKKETGVPISKTNVLRAGLRLMAAKWLD
jgi:hypothetical protein